MAIKAVNNWLNGNRNYTKGAQLYNQYGSSAVLKNLFKSQNSYTEKKLLQELEQLNIAAPAVVPVATTPPKTTKRGLMNLATFKTKKQEYVPPIDLSNAPVPLQQLDKRRKELFQQAKELHSALAAGEFKTQPEAYKALVIINENFYGHRGIQQIWERIDYWHKHGTFIPFHAKPPTIPVNRSELITKRNTLRTYLSRYKNKPEKAHLYDKYLQEHQEVEQQLIDNAKAE